MPKGPRGSRGKSKGRSNYVRLAIRTIEAPGGTTKDMLRQILIDSLDDPDYALPAGFVVEIGWSNSPGKELKYDEWSNALIDSSTYSRGWDKLMLNYLSSH